MGDILRVPNGNGLLITPRSGSHSMCIAALASFWPELKIKEEGHPAWYLPIQERWEENNLNIGIIVRNPVERFRSMVAHKPDLSLEQHLANPIYPQLPRGNFVKYFKFETQLQDCADWLGITITLQQIDLTEDGLKPNLTLDQENIIKQIFQDDIILWESLQ